MLACFGWTEQLYTSPTASYLKPVHADIYNRTVTMQNTNMQLRL